MEFFLLRVNFLVWFSFQKFFTSILFFVISELVTTKKNIDIILPWILLTLMKRYCAKFIQKNSTQQKKFSQTVCYFREKGEVYAQKTVGNCRELNNKWLYSVYQHSKSRGTTESSNVHWSLQGSLSFSSCAMDTYLPVLYVYQISLK